MIAPTRSFNPSTAHPLHAAFLALLPKLPPDAAAFRIDWSHFLATLSERDRQLAHFLSLGHRAKVAAKKFKLSPGRVTQLCQQWCKEWLACQGEDDAADENGAGCRKETMGAS